LDEPGGHAFRVIEQRLQQVIGAELLVPFALGNTLRGLHETLGAIRVLHEVHLSLLGTGARPNRARKPPSSDRIETKAPSGPRAAPAVKASLATYRVAVEGAKALDPRQFCGLPALLACPRLARLARDRRAAGGRWGEPKAADGGPIELNDVDGSRDSRI